MKNTSKKNGEVVLDAVGQRERAKIQGYTGDSCVGMWIFQMVLKWIFCLKCNSCGTTTGCS